VGGSGSLQHDQYVPWTQPQRNNKSCTVLYPGGVLQSKSPRVVPALSLELTRDGIEDYEYVTMLQAKAARFKNTNSETARRLNGLVERCRAFYVEPQLVRTDFRTIDALTGLRAEIARELEREWQSVRPRLQNMHLRTLRSPRCFRYPFSYFVRPQYRNAESQGPS